MALSFKKSRRQRRVLMSDINVTPMIDVMLVLMIIFMITAPMMQAGVKVNLPSASAPNITENTKPMVVTVNNAGKVFIGDIEVEPDTVGIKLKTMIADADTRIYVKGDRGLAYGSIMQVMGYISDAGFKRVVLITELPKKRDNR